MKDRFRSLNRAWKICRNVTYTGQSASTAKTCSKMRPADRNVATASCQDKAIHADLILKRTVAGTWHGPKHNRANNLCSSIDLDQVQLPWRRFQTPSRGPECPLSLGTPCLACWRAIASKYSFKVLPAQLRLDSMRCTGKPTLDATWIYRSRH